MKKFIKVSSLFLMLFSSQGLLAAQTISGDVTLINPDNGYIYIGYHTSPSVNKCTLNGKWFSLATSHPMFDEIYTVLMSAFMADLPFTAEVEADSLNNGVCTVVSASVRKPLN